MPHDPTVFPINNPSASSFSGTINSSDEIPLAPSPATCQPLSRAEYGMRLGGVGCATPFLLVGITLVAAALHQGSETPIYMAAGTFCLSAICGVLGSGVGYLMNQEPVNS